MNFIIKKMNKKGFSLIELIVVIAILAIIAAVAIPRFAGIQERSEIRADAATAAEIVNAARIEETESGTAITAGDPVTTIDSDYMNVPASSQSGGAYAISGGGSSAYAVTWTPTGGVAEVVTENVEWSTTN